MDSFTEVLVVGAGPTGLMLAGDLARAGVDCTVLDRMRPTSDGSSPPLRRAGRQTTYSTATTPSDIPSGAP